MIREISRRFSRRIHRNPPAAASTLPNLFFLHLPKCGGCSMLRAFGEHYSASPNTHLLDAVGSAAVAKATDRNALDYRRDILLYLMSSMRNRESCYISGHFAFSQMAYELFGDEWAYVTVLRHPVERWFSDYFYNKTRGGVHGGIEDDLRDFVESDRAAMMGRTYPRYLVEGMERMDDEDRVSKSIDVLKKFSLIGCLESLDAFVLKFEQIFGM